MGAVVAPGLGGGGVLVATGDELAGALRYGTLLLLSNHFLGDIILYILWPDHILYTIIAIDL